MEKKIEIKDYLERLEINYFNRDISSIVMGLNSKERFYAERGYRRIGIEADQNYEDVVINVIGYRFETDVEFALRKQKDAYDKMVKKHKKEIARIEKEQKEQLAKLKLKK